MRWIAMMLVAALVFGGAGLAVAGPVNPSFEDGGGSLTGWSTSGQAGAWEVVEAASATDGDYWATGQAIAQTTDLVNASTTLSQEFDLPAATQSFSVDLARFKAGGDLASFEVKLAASGASDLVIWSDAVDPSPYDIGFTDNPLSGAHRFAVDSGALTELLGRTVTFSVYLEAAPGEFNPTTSGMHVDNLVVTIPEPASLALLGLGGLMMVGRRRRIASRDSGL